MAHEAYVTRKLLTKALWCPSEGNSNRWDQLLLWYLTKLESSLRGSSSGGGILPEPDPLYLSLLLLSLSKSTLPKQSPKHQVQSSGGGKERRSVVVSVNSFWENSTPIGWTSQWGFLFCQIELISPDGNPLRRAPKRVEEGINKEDQVPGEYHPYWMILSVRIPVLSNIKVKVDLTGWNSLQKGTKGLW